MSTAQNAQLNPAARAIVSEPITEISAPFQLLPHFANQPYLALLENPGVATNYGRYSFLCVDPIWTFSSKRNKAWSGPPGAARRVSVPPLVELSNLLKRYRVGSQQWPEGTLPFLGGAVGYLGYETIYLIENIPDLGADDLNLPDIYLMFYDVVYATDHLANKSWIIANGFGADQDDAENKAMERLNWARSQVVLHEDSYSTLAQMYRTQAKAARIRRPRLAEKDLSDYGVTPHVTREGYLEAIEACKEEIAKGNSFEICLTQRFDGTYNGAGLDLYGTLRAVSPNPMAAYLRFPECEVLSSSPERFISVSRDRKIETRPIKGTRPRGKTPEEDKAFYNDLATCEKDAAENVMIVDLVRNDLGRVCKLGSVHVPELRIIERYPFSWQMVSTVRGVLRDDADLVDVLKAVFPGGSMTGAPKVESMKIIDRLEPTKRGVYSGGIGYFDFDGGLDLSIVIRTLIKKNSLVTFHVGGAIVADSDPETEYQETLDKAYGLLLALAVASQNPLITNTRDASLPPPAEMSIPGTGDTANLPQVPANGPSLVPGSRSQAR